MCNTPRLRNLLVVWLWMLCGSGWSLARANEPVAEQDLKAAYVFNFIQFIEWPEGDAAASGDLTLCVSPFSPLKRALAALEGKQAARGRTVRVKLLETASLRQCRVLILHNTDVEPALRALRTLPAAHGVLSISDDLTFVHPEIVIALTEQQGRIVFGINADAAARAGLTISSRLLRLAKAGR